MPEDWWWTHLEGWKIVDRRTGERVSVVTWMSEESAWASIAEWEERDKRGGRPDVHHLMGHLEPRREESNGEE